MSNQVSDQEIEREIQTLRNLRRRSITSAGPGALPLDPDLPPPSPNSRASFEANPQYTSNDDITLSTPDGLDGDGLFWVPAHLHPELAPGEFRAFLKSHTSTDPTHADASDAGDAPGMSRSRSWITRNPSGRGSEGLGRKRSMLSRQYQPSAGDNVEEERPPLPTPKPVNIYGGRSGEKGLTLEDLQRLEQLVDEAGEDVDPENMRNLLRRSLSMNVAPGFLQDDVPQGDNADAPLVAPRPGSILRRSARTKIRKAGLSGDGGGHRFAATRKGRMTAAPQREIPGLEDDDYASAPESPHRQGSDGASVESEDKFHDAHESHEGTSSHIEIQRDSDASTDEAHIFDAYVREPSSSVSSSSHDHSSSPSPEPSSPSRKLSLPPVPESGETTDWFTTEYDRTPTQESLSDPLASKPSSAEEKAFTAGVDGLSINTTFGEHDDTAPRYAQLPVEQDLPPGMAPPAQRMSLPPKPLPAPAQPPSPVNIETPQLARIETNVSTSSVSTSGTTTTKEKKGKFFSKKKDDKEKKGKKDKDRFLGSLFGGKKKNEESTSVSNFSSAGPAAAAALLGTSKSAKSVGAPPSPSPTSVSFQNYARYPIHVERAVYRLSHIKLANARRPLYEQVLISNLMFWYLGILGRNVTEEKKAIGDEKKEEVKPVIKGTPPKPADTGSAAKPGTVIQRPPLNPAPPREETPVEHRPTPAQQAPAPTKKSGLSKPERARDGRNNEAPMRAPSYGAQTAQVDQEVRNQMMNQQMGGVMRGPPPQHAQPPSPQGPPGSYPQARPPSPQQTPRPMASSGPARALSPPSLGMNGPRSPEAGYHRDIPSAARGVPQSSFGPPPPPNGQVVGEDRRDMRQRTLSNPNLPHPGPTPPPGGASPRRVVTEGRMPVESAPRPLYPPHSGPQPGQLFQYPAGAAAPSFARPVSPGPQPGQVFNHPRPPQSMSPQPGQIFQHPQHHPPPHPHPQARPPHPQYGQRPLPPPGQAHGWEPPQRLPPGASPPQWAGVRPPAQQGAPGFDPRRGYPPQSQGQPQGYYGGAGPSPTPGQPLGRPVAVQQGQGYLPAGEYGHHR
ncbi:hypothetical protein LQV05_004615 [Cryptococcus neoformans]|nr:hypothetical protein J007_03953 [Cryptococcus neoformans var. grubii]OXC60498.1 hypothetical protein C358_04050 [Cryptococcus neoformans var. grubii MW-RSA852]UOH81934.1 hypothetical protein LQV05_004615 [Cryptococcus neoformans]